jgi:hypothetical protein
MLTFLRDVVSVAKELHIADRSAPASTFEKQPGYNNLWLHSMVNGLFPGESEYGSFHH